MFECAKNMFGDTQTQHISTDTSYQLWWKGDDLSFFYTTGPGHLAVRKSTMNSSV